METIIGKVAVTPKGEYAQGVYEKLDIVTYQGAGYISKKNENTSIPTDNESWMKIVQNGENGLNGQKGDDGEPGADGADGQDSEIFRGAINLSTPTPTLAGIYQPTVSGTYTNFGGIVVNLANGFTTISFDGTNYRQQVNPLPAGVVTWTATAFATNTLVSHQGKYWRSNAAIIATDVPGTSSKWVEELRGYLNTEISYTIANAPLTEGFLLNSAGVNFASASFGVTPFIDVENAYSILMSNVNGSSATLGFFDKDYVQVKNIIITNGGSNGGDNLVMYGVPLAAKYVKTSVTLSKKDNFKIVVNGKNTDVNDFLRAVRKDYLVPNDNMIPSTVTYETDKLINVSGTIATQPGGVFNVSSMIPIVGGLEYKLNIGSASSFLNVYAGDEIVSIVNIASANTVFTAPVGATGVRSTVRTTSIPTVRLTYNGTEIVNRNKSTSSTVVSTVVQSIDCGKSDLGALRFQPFINDGYNHIIMQGQSLSVGDQTYVGLSTTPVADTFMIGAQTREVVGAFNPLVSGVVSGTSAEHPVTPLVHSLKTTTKRTHLADAKFIGTSVGTGAQTIEALSKNCTATVGDDPLLNLYHTRFLQSLATAKANAGATKIVCPAILFMQGEFNQRNNSYTGLTNGSTQDKTKAGYKALLLALKNDMQADVMSVYGQTEKPLFYVYQTSVGYLDISKMPITQAQFEFAQENDDVILLNPHYYVTTEAGSGTGGHLNANGSRWYGEQMAKAVYATHIRNERFKPVTPEKFRINPKEILIDFHIPVGPLVIDTKTIPSQVSLGFRVIKNDVNIAIGSINLINGKTIQIKTVDSIDTGVIEVMYAGLPTLGRGNIRDSDKTISFSKYVDDTGNVNTIAPYQPVDENNVNYFGRNYPLFNWLSNFYIKIQG